MTAIIAPVLALGLLAPLPCHLPAWLPPVTGTFEPPAHRWQPGHRGVDLQAAPGDEVRAWAAGTVVFAGQVAGKPVVSVRLPGRSQARYTYEPLATELAAGDHVRRGDVIGVVAPSGGHCAGACLHVGLRTDDAYVDPRSPLCSPVLKPWDVPAHT